MSKENVLGSCLGDNFGQHRGRGTINQRFWASIAEDSGDHIWSKFFESPINSLISEISVHAVVVKIEQE